MRINSRTSPRGVAGDFNADATVDTSDFNIWNANKFTVSDAVFRSSAPRVSLGFLQMGDRLPAEYTVEIEPLRTQPPQRWTRSTVNRVDAVFAESRGRQGDSNEQENEGSLFDLAAGLPISSWI